jgi:hypothetical protein
MTVVRRPRLLPDNGSSYVATDLAEWLDQQNMEHVLRNAQPILARRVQVDGAG